MACFRVSLSPPGHIAGDSRDDALYDADELPARGEEIQVIDNTGADRRGVVMDIQELPEGPVIYASENSYST
jgi:hypothetical protein